jgi:glycosyltransferase involved in cell wall biosynthesis
MPAYNEHDHISDCIDRVETRLHDFGLSYEIIVVDDGSTDHTREIISSSKKNSNVIVVGYERNQGKGWAARYGLRYATGDVVMFLDSDNEIYADDLKLYVEELGRFDIVIASKRHPQSQIDTPGLRRFLSFAFNVLIQIATGLKVSDTQAGLKALRGNAIRKILPLLSVKRYAYDVELLTVASLLNMKVTELPVRIHLKALFPIRHILRILIDLMGITYRLRIKRWYQKNLDNPNANYKPIIKW